LFVVLCCQIPPMTDYNVSDGQTYRYLRDDPLYPFGYGLSYSQFHYSNITVRPSVIRAGQNVSVHLNVTNMGPYDADEVIYIERCMYVAVDVRENFISELILSHRSWYFQEATRGLNTTWHVSAVMRWNFEPLKVWRFLQLRNYFKPSNHRDTRFHLCITKSTSKSVEFPYLVMLDVKCLMSSVFSACGNRIVQWWQIVLGETDSDK